MAEDELEKIVSRHEMQYLELKENRKGNAIGGLICWPKKNCWS